MKSHLAHSQTAESNLFCSTILRDCMGMRLCLLHAYQKMVEVIQSLMKEKSFCFPPPNFYRASFIFSLTFLCLFFIFYCHFLLSHLQALRKKQLIVEGKLGMYGKILETTPSEIRKEFGK